MAIMDIMGLDEQAKLFESGNPDWATTSAYSTASDVKEGHSFCDLKNTRLAVGKDKDGRDIRSATNGSHRSKGVVSNDIREKNQTASNGCLLINKSDLGFPHSEEEIPILSDDPPQDLGRKEKVCEFFSSSGENFISVFIGNLPYFANNRWIFDKFSKLGKVADYYVSGRLSKFSKKLFGFVRFHSLEDANKAVDHFNGAWVDGFKLEVELARFPRRMKKDEDNRIFLFSREEQSSFPKGTKEGIRFADAPKVWLNPNKTFAQVLAGNTDAKMSDVGIPITNRIKVKAEVNECDWLNTSVVEKIKWGASIRKARKELLSHVKGLKSVSRLGIRKLILSFVSVEDRNHAIICGEWMGFLEDVREWRGELVCADKLWNISCFGIPINAWNIESFRSIAGVWGSMVYIDDASLKGEDFRMANFMIESELEVKNTFMDLIVGNKVFQIKVNVDMMENQVGKMDEDGILKWINEKEISGWDTLNMVLPYANASKVCDSRRVDNMINTSDGSHNTERHDELVTAERIKKNSTSTTDSQVQINKWVVDCTATERIDEVLISSFDCQEQVVNEAKAVLAEGSVESMANSLDDSQNIKGPFECTAAEKSIEVEVEDLRYAKKELDSVALNGRLNLDMNVVDDLKGDNAQVIMLTAEREINHALDYVSSASDHIFLNISDQKIASGPGQVSCLTDLEKDSPDCMVQDVLIHGASELEKSYDLHETENKFSAIGVVSGLTNGKQGRDVEKLSAANHNAESQINAKSVSFSGVEKEVKAMMDLGNLLNIPNSHHFEEAVRDTTTEELMDDPSSISGRVKSKRKYAGKSKVQFGCRLKKG